MGEDYAKYLGAIYDRLTKIEAILELKEKAEKESSIGPRVQKLEIEYATMKGKMTMIGAVAGLVVSIALKFI
jgi:hypothetical protein